MKSAARRQLGRPALDLVEEAVHLLRDAPLGVHIAYHLGTVPFVVALLWFWSDMTRGAYADRRCAGAALGLALLYLWMKAWQAVFSARLAARVRLQDEAPWSAGRWLRILATQAAIHPWGLLLFPASFLPLMVPTPWVFAVLQGVTATADASDGSALECLRRAWRSNARWSGQNHAIVGLLIVVAAGVLLNAAVVLAILPHLAKTLFGLDSQFTLSHESLLNTTFLMAACAVSYLVLDPLVKAVYALRTFESESVHNGDDLRARLKACRAARNAAVLAVLVLAPWLVAPPARAADPAPANAPLSVRPPELDRALKSVLEHADYTWRAPREQSPDEPAHPGENRLMAWLRARARSVGDFLDRNIGNFFGSLGNWIRRLLNPATPPSLPTGKDQVDWASGLRLLLVLLIVAGVVWLGWLSWRLWSRRRVRVVREAPVLRTAPDLTRENVSADQLPEDEWLALARDLAARGDLRLALRAVYLASLAHLARRELVRLAAFKTNREYHLELLRRARAIPSLPPEFAATAAVFDRVWYGNHPASGEALAEAELRLEAIRNARP